MINFSIKELNAFAVIGQEVELTNYQKKNIQISTQFWRKFNSSLKKAYLSQSGNWVKYAFMERRNGTPTVSTQGLSTSATRSFLKTKTSAKHQTSKKKISS